jgi:succinate dehydrogenase/fumarate reductase flavoprotein subunit
MEIVGSEEFEVIVVGAGNAATCAALSARENGARVLMPEIAPEEARGRNSAFTGGAFRVVYCRIAGRSAASFAAILETKK